MTEHLHELDRSERFARTQSDPVVSHVEKRPPWWLWKCAHQPVASDTRRWCWGCDDPSDAERAELRRLADAAGGWWVWLHHPTESFRPAECPCDECKTERNWTHSGLRFVPIDVWRAAVALGNERAARAMLAEHLASQVGT